MIVTGSAAVGALALAWQTQSSGDIDALVANAQPGSAITLPAANGQSLTIINRRFSPAIRINANAARLGAIVIRNSSGVEIDGGTISGPGGRSYGVHVLDSRDIRISGMTVTGSHRGIVIARSQGVAAVGNRLVGVLAEGINIGQSQNILVQNNVCSDFNPTMASYEPDGTRIADGDHPDCIQAWSRPSSLPTSDVRVLGNRATGRMQGIFFGNHIRDGVNDGGFDRITIANNVVQVSLPNGISLYGARNSAVTGNRISTVPGAVSQRPPHNPVVASLRVLESVATQVCGNQIAGRPYTAGSAACPRSPL